MDKECFKWPVRVYYEDTDCARIVYYANYLRFLERARTEWLRSLGWDQENMYRELGTIFVVAGIEVKYHKPAVLDDLLEVRCRMGECRKASIYFEQEIWRGDERLITARVRCGILDVHTYKPKVMPERLLKQLTES